MKIYKLLLIALISFSSTLGFAADNGFYAGGEVGYSNIKNTTAQDATAFVNTFGGSVTVTQSSNVVDGRLFVGYNFNQNIGVEVAYIKTSDITENVSGVTGPAYNLTPYTASASTSLYGFDYSVLLRPSISTGWNGLFLRAGGHYFDASTSGAVTVGNISASANSTQNGSGYLIGVGYDAPVARNVKIRTSYTYYGNVAGASGAYANVVSLGLLFNF